MDNPRAVSPVVVSSEGCQLTKNTVREEVLLKIESFGVGNLSVKESKDLGESEKKFVALFLKLSYRFFGLSHGQLKTFEKDHLIELADIIAERARPFALIAEILYFTGIGTFFLFLRSPPDDVVKSGSDCWNYLWHKKKLERAYGRDYLSPDKL